MRVLLVSEGLHEGSGALESLVRKAVPDVAECEFRRVKDSRFRLHRGKDSGYFKRAVAWIIEARKDGFDAIALVIDEDGDAERVSELTNAQYETERSGDMPRAMGVAIRTFDAWMLADEVAISDVLRCPIQRQRAPESDRNPKQRCKELLEQAQASIAQREMYAEIAHKVDLQVLCERCPLGFGEFLGRLRSLHGG